MGFCACYDTRRHLADCLPKSQARNLKSTANSRKNERLRGRDGPSREPNFSEARARPHREKPEKNDTPGFPKNKKLQARRGRLQFCYIRATSSESRESLDLRACRRGPEGSRNRPFSRARGGKGELEERRPTDQITTVGGLWEPVVCGGRSCRSMVAWHGRQRRRAN